MFKIYNGRSSFYQWDLDQKLIVPDGICDEVHFSDTSGDCCPVVEVYEQAGQRLANVPNVLLQQANPLTLYAYVKGPDEAYTRVSAAFRVLPRPKPDDYVYTETEVKTWEALDKRLTVLEEESGASIELDTTLTEAGKAADAKAVGDALAKLPSGGGGETWELIRDDTLTEETKDYFVSTDSNGNPFALKKLMVEVYADTTSGVYPSGHILFYLYQKNDTSNGAKILYSSTPLPSTEGKVSFLRFDAEVIGTNAFACVSVQKNADGFDYTNIGTAVGLSRSQAFPLNDESIKMFKLEYGGTAYHVGTRFVVWGVRA